jgi:hypothetical protein
LATTTIVNHDAICRLVAVQVNRRMLTYVVEEYAFCTIGKVLPVGNGEVVSPRRFRLIHLGAVVSLPLGAIGIPFSHGLRVTIS